MEIHKTIKLNITKRGKCLVIRDLGTLQMIMGTTSIGGCMNMYKITKDKNKYVVPIDSIKRRIDDIESKIERMTEYLDIMKQVVK